MIKGWAAWALMAVVATAGGAARGEQAMDAKAFPVDPALFEPMPKPAPGDWLAGPGKDEPEATFEAYVQAGPPRRTAERRVIVLQPLGAFSPAARAMLERVRQYCALYFDTPARIEPPRALPTRGLRTRYADGPRGDQYLAPAILGDVLLPNLPADAVCCLGVTMEDLYPEAGWNFVFGQASLRDRVGVYSFARYRPEFHGETPGPEAERLLLKRSIKVMVHETGHMFGLGHCRTYRCVENGSNHLAESDARPVFLCPNCLRKLRWNLGFDVATRYEKMRAFWEENGFPDEAAWLRRRLDTLDAKKNGTPGTEE